MFHYFAVYKPFQVLCQFSPVPGKETLANHFAVPKDVYPVGRLDFDSEGLLILTNDTTLNKLLLDPASKMPKEYWAQVEGAITPAAIMQLQKGVTINIDGRQHRTRPAKAAIFEAAPNLPDRNPPIRFRKNIPTTWISLQLQEGKNRQVRRMTAAVGFPTLRLVRWRLGKISLEGMQPGDICELKRSDF